MSIDKIQRSLEVIAEGIDTNDVSLILEASKEFEDADKKIKETVDSILTALEEFPELSRFTEAIKELRRSLEKVNINDIQDEYSFSSHEKMKSSDGEDPTATIISVSNEISAYVNGLKEAIISIAEWLEQTPELFSVSSNGVSVNPDFAAKNIGQPLSLSMFSQPKGEEILQAIAEEQDEEKLKTHFTEFWNTDDVLPEKEDEAWTKFVDGISQVGAGAQKAYDNASESLVGAKPDPEVQKTANSSGSLLKDIISSLFGSKESSIGPTLKDIKEDVLGENPSGASRGLFAMSFESFKNLVSKLIEMTQAASKGSKESIQNVDAHNKKMMDPDPDQAQLAEKIMSTVKDKDMSLKICAALEKSGMKNNDPKTVNIDDFKKKLGDLGVEEQGIEKLFNDLEIKTTESDENKLNPNPEEVEQGLEDIAQKIKDKQARKELAAMLRSKYNTFYKPFYKKKGTKSIDQLVDEFFDGKEDIEDPNNEIDKEIEEEVRELLKDPDEIEESFVHEDELIDGKSSIIYHETIMQENFRRWQVLAGIIKG